MSKIIKTLLSVIAMITAPTHTIFSSAIPATPSQYAQLSHDVSIVPPYTKSDPRRCAVDAAAHATKYAANKAKREDYYAARVDARNTRFAAKRAKRAVHFDANQRAKQGRIAVRRAIREARY